jgi:hypothetical protein
MRTINSIAAIPVQSIQISIGDHDYEIRLISCDSFMAYDLSIDGVKIVDGLRFITGQMMIPYAHQEVDGNFILDTGSRDAPVDYTKFGDSQFLRYFDAQESAAWREAWKRGEY